MRSVGCTCETEDDTLAGGALASVRKPRLFLPTRRSMILSRPTKAPPQMKRMFVVSIW
jgi:hypothetical protein